MTNSTISFVLFVLSLIAFSGNASGQILDVNKNQTINSVEKVAVESESILTAKSNVIHNNNVKYTVALPVDSVVLSPDYYDKTYIKSYMDISLFFAKDITTVNGKFYMAPENVTIASTPYQAHRPNYDYPYQIGYSNYLYYCDSIEIRNNNEIFIPYINYFSSSEHHLKYDTKYNLLFVGDITFSDESTYTSTESDVIAQFNTASVPAKRIKDKGTFTVADIPNIGFSKEYLENPLETRYRSAIYGKTAIHNLTPLSDENITGNDINVAIVDLQIFKNSLVNKAVVYRSHPLEDEMFIEKDKIVSLSQDIESVLPLYNHGTQMARYMLNYAPKINIFCFNKAQNMKDVFIDSLMAETIMDTTFNIDIASFSGSDSAIEKLAEGVHDGLIVSRSLGNINTIKNTFDNYMFKNILLPHYSPFLTGDNKETIKGAYVTLQGVLFYQCRPSNGPGDLCLNTAECVRSEAGDARYYTLSIIENGNGATSEATATFSGMAALMLEANKKYKRNLTPRQVVEIMFQTAIDIGEPGVDSIFGWGVPDLGAALEVIKTNAPITFSLYEVMEPSTGNTDIAEKPFDLKIFPNPTAQSITIKFNSRGGNITSIKLFDIYGKEFLSKRVDYNANMIDIDLKQLPPGVYIVNSYLENGSKISRKVIKK
jgi:hypothetical protein